MADKEEVPCLSHNSMIEQKVRQLSSSALSFVGDAVFTLYVRQYLVSVHDSKSGGLHNMQSKFVSAKSQARFADKIYNILTQYEQYIFDRCRNAHVDHKPHSVSFYEYKQASGLEGLIGYLHLCGHEERVQELCAICVQS